MNTFGSMTLKNILNTSFAIGLIFVLTGWSKVDTRAEQILSYCFQFQKLQVDIRERTISPDSAAGLFKVIMKNLRQLVQDPDPCGPGNSPTFVYPLRGYNLRYSIGGGGKGFRANGFDLFDMDVRGSHPAHDLFIRDGNQDNIDDYMCNPVDLLSFTRGIVLAVEKDWQPASELRGGNFIWVYDPCLNGLFYYAHNNRVVVEPGQWVEAGEKIGEVGRTGFNAYKERSPTHVHMMFLRLTPEYLPEPANTLAWLRQAEVKGWDEGD